MCKLSNQTNEIYTLLSVTFSYEILRFEPPPTQNGPSKGFQFPTQNDPQIRGSNCVTYFFFLQLDLYENNYEK